VNEQKKSYFTEGETCPDCNGNNPPDSQFCEFCGYRLLSLKSRNALNYKFMPRNEKIKLATKKVAIIVGVLFIVGFSVFLAIGSHLTNPTRVVERYFEAIVDGDYDVAFEFLALEETEFVNREGFVRYMEMYYSELNDLTFAIEEQSSTERNSANEPSHMNSTRRFTVNFEDGNGRNQSTRTVNLVRVALKMAFFNDYAVCIGDVLIHTHTISAPQGSSVFLNGIELALRESDENAETTGNQGWGWNTNTANLDTFIVPAIFPGNHELLVTSNITENYNETILITAGGRDTVVSQRLLCNNIHMELQQQVVDIISSVYEGVIESNDFSAIEEYFAETALTGWSSAPDQYNRLIANRGSGSNNRLVTFSNELIPPSDDISAVEIRNDRVTITLNYTYEYTMEVVTTTGWGANQVTTTNLHSNVSETNVRANFVFEDGRWLLTEFIGLPNLTTR
jgi:ribosomal protein L40E